MGCARAGTEDESERDFGGGLWAACAVTKLGVHDCAVCAVRTSPGATLPDLPWRSTPEQGMPILPLAALGAAPPGDCARALPGRPPPPTCSLPLPTPEPSAQNDPDEFIAYQKTLDPEFLKYKPKNAGAGGPQLPPAFGYAGMPHPPPPAGGQPAACGLPWSAPYLEGYQSASARAEWGAELKLTMCNWCARGGRRAARAARARLCGGRGGTWLRAMGAGGPSRPPSGDAPLTTS